MNNVNWNDVPDEMALPTPGGYIAKITRVEDYEDKEYLKIEWDFYEGELKDSNRACFEANGFCPMGFIRSYKQKALRFFKGFKTSVEMSNRNYVFNNDPQSLVGKFVGVVLGEEEYRAKDGSVKTRLYVAECRSGKAIRDGDFRVPELKKLAPSAAAPAAPAAPAANYAPIMTDDDDLPF